jgi:hypothetical protein
MNYTSVLITDPLLCKNSIVSDIKIVFRNGEVRKLDDFNYFVYELNGDPTQFTSYSINDGPLRPVYYLIVDGQLIPSDRVDPRTVKVGLEITDNEAGTDLFFLSKPFADREWKNMMKLADTVAQKYDPNISRQIIYTLSAVDLDKKSRRGKIENYGVAGSYGPIVTVKKFGTEEEAEQEKEIYEDVEDENIFGVFREVYGAKFQNELYLEYIPGVPFRDFIKNNIKNFLRVFILICLALEASNYKHETLGINNILIKEIEPYTFETRFGHFTTTYQPKIIDQKIGDGKKLRDAKTILDQSNNVNFDIEDKYPFLFKYFEKTGKTLKDYLNYLYNQDEVRQLFTL